MTNAFLVTYQSDKSHIGYGAALAHYFCAGLERLNALYCYNIDWAVISGKNDIQWSAIHLNLPYVLPTITTNMFANMQIVLFSLSYDKPIIVKPPWQVKPDSQTLLY